MDPSENEVIRADAEESMLRFRVGTSKRVLIGVCSAGAVLVALAWSAPHRHWLALWYAAVLLSQVVRMWTERHSCQIDSGHPLRKRMAIASASALLSGVVQASSVLFFALEGPFEQSLHTLILLVMSTGAVVYTAGHPRTYLPYMVPIMGSLAIGWWTLSAALLERPLVAAGFGALLLVYGYNLVGYARDTWSMFVNTAAMRHHEAAQNRRLADAVRAAEAASQAKTRFLAAASHDLRQPIHTIALLAGLLKLRHQQDQDTEAVSLLDAVVQSLAQQLDDLLDISKLDAGVVKATPQVLFLSGFLRHQLEEVRTAAQGKGLALRLDMPRDAAVFTDPPLLERVIRNLLSNAVKFTNHGEVALGLQVLGNDAVIRIQDTGCGIDAAYHRDIFHEFVQLNNPERDRTKGMGLGLSIVERLCSLLAIDLTLRSAPGQGTLFELRLPVHQAPVSASRSEATIAWGRQLNLCVLVVDDETQVRAATAMLLTDLGCRCLQADDVDSALRITEHERPDVLLADFRLRGSQTGIDVVQHLRERFAALPAAIVSGDIGPEQLQAIEQAGLPLVHKPVQLETLLNVLGALGTNRGDDPRADRQIIPVA